MESGSLHGDSDSRGGARGFQGPPRGRFAAAAVFCFSVLWSAGAFAGNANSFFLGNDAALAAGAIAARTRDSEAIWYNPAGLGGNRFARINLSGTVFMLRIQSIIDGMRTKLPSGTRDQNIGADEYFSAPSALTFMRKWNDEVSWGIGIYVPVYQDMIFNESINSRENFPSMGDVIYEQGVDDGVLHIQYNFVGAVGWQLNPRLRLGASLVALYDNSRQEQDQFENIYSADGSGRVSRFYVNNASASISSAGVRATFGAQYEMSPDWRLGLVVFTPTFQIYTWGEVSSATGVAGLASSATHTFVNLHEWEGDMIEPFHAQVSLAWEKPHYWMGLAADVYAPLENSTLLVSKRLNWNVSAGSKFRITETLYGGAGLFTDRSDADSPHEFGEDRVDYYGLTLGLDFRTPISRGSSPDEPPIVFTSTLAGRYALGVGQAGGQVFDPTRDENITSAHVRSVGVHFDELSLYVGGGLVF